MEKLIKKLEKALNNCWWIKNDRHADTLSEIWQIKEEMKNAIQKQENAGTGPKIADKIESEA